MPSISSLLQRIPDEFKPMAAFGIGGLILVALVLVHGIGLHKILVRFKRRELLLRSGRPHLESARLHFGWAVFQMLALHVMEIMIWAVLLTWMGLVLRPLDAVYFCANSYTTLGFGNIDLGPQWRNISPVIAISGLFTFAWTTSSLVTIVGSYAKLIEQLEVERAEELAMRAAAKKAGIEVLKEEKTKETVEVLAAREATGKTPFFQRHKIWKQERIEVDELRSAAKKEVRDLHVKERSEEEKLGDITSQDQSEAGK